MIPGSAWRWRVWTQVFAFSNDASGACRMGSAGPGELFVGRGDVLGLYRRLLLLRHCYESKLVQDFGSLKGSSVRIRIHRG